MANPAIVEMTSEIGTTVSTMRVLDFSSVVMLATLNASTKLPHCGWVGQSSRWATIPTAAARS